MVLCKCLELCLLWSHILHLDWTCVLCMCPHRWELILPIQWCWRVSHASHTSVASVVVTHIKPHMDGSSIHSWVYQTSECGCRHIPYMHQQYMSGGPYPWPASLRACSLAFCDYLGRGHPKVPGEMLEWLRELVRIKHTGLSLYEPAFLNHTADIRSANVWVSTATALDMHETGCKSPVWYSTKDSQLNLSPALHSWLPVWFRLNPRSHHSNSYSMINDSDNNEELVWGSHFNCDDNKIQIPRISSLELLQEQNSFQKQYDNNCRLVRRTFPSDICRLHMCLPVTLEDIGELLITEVQECTPFTEPTHRPRCSQARFSHHIQYHVMCAAMMGYELCSGLSLLCNHTFCQTEVVTQEGWSHHGGGAFTKRWDVEPYFKWQSHNRGNCSREEPHDGDHCTINKCDKPIASCIAASLVVHQLCGYHYHYSW